jgi:hypothetical protein
MTFHFIDIGQGDATLLEFPCGAVLIDTGGEQNELFDSNKALLAYLDAFFARRRTSPAPSTSCSSPTRTSTTTGPPSPCSSATRSAA